MEFVLDCLTVLGFLALVTGGSLLVGAGMGYLHTRHPKTYDRIERATWRL